MNLSSPDQLEHDLHAYFDGELNDSAAAKLESELGEHPELAARFEDLRFLRTMVGSSLEQAGEEIDNARFEQVWDAFDAHVDRESRLKEAVEPPQTVWGRISSFVKTPVAWGAGGLAAAAAVAFVVMAANQGTSNTPVADASDPTPAAEAFAKAAPDAPNTPVVAPRPDQLPGQLPPGQLADAKSPTESPAMKMFPEPEANDAEVEIIDFAGHSGRVSHIDGTHGTTTVIWIQEDDEAVDSERSL